MRKAIHLANLQRAGRSSGNLTMNAIPNPALGSETSGREDFTVGIRMLWSLLITGHGAKIKSHAK